MFPFWIGRIDWLYELKFNLVEGIFEPQYWQAVGVYFNFINYAKN